MAEQTIGPYRVIRRLGAGGMGEVFLAEDSRLDRQVAIKLLPVDLADDPIRRNRFVAEAKSASALNHPHVCVIYEVGETDDHQLYIAMELLEGRTLEEEIQAQPIETRRLVSIATKIADALEAAHSAGIVHRDIKPANVHVGKRDLIKVLDFGLAKRFSQPEPEATLDGMTQDGQVLGTPSYMSPEQALGHEVDGRSDIFSLGILMYHMATGRVPFAGNSLGDTMRRITSVQPDAIARFNYESPAELERIVLKCLQKDPQRRYQSAQDLVVDLENLTRTLETSEILSTSQVSAVTTNSGVEASIHSGAPVVDSPVSVDDLENSDVVISCAQIDNEPLPPEREGWASHFQRNLAIRVEQLIGERVRISSVPMPPGDQECNETLLDVLPSAKTLISVVSPPFAKSKGCQRAVEKFCRGESGSALKSRLIKVMKTPVSGHEIPSHLAEQLSQVMCFEFFEEDPDTGRIREFDERFGPEARQRYYERVYDVAHEIARVLQAMDSVQTDELSTDQKVIFLATTTSDLNEDREVLRRELQARGYKVLPEVPLPLVQSEFVETVERLVSQSDLCVHPVGGKYGLILEGADKSNLELQWQLAGEQGVERLVWIPSDCVITDDRQESWISCLREAPDDDSHTELVEDRLGAVKQALFDRLEREESPVARSNDEPPRLYLICDQSDEEATEQLEDFFYEQGIEVVLPAFEASEAEVQQAHLDNLTLCDAAVVYFGSAGKHWVDSHIRDLAKASGYRQGKQIDVKSVFIAPPFDRRKERFKSLSVEVIRQPAEFDTNLLAPLVEQIKATR